MVAVERGQEQNWTGFVTKSLKIARLLKEAVVKMTQGRNFGDSWIFKELREI